MYLLFLKIASRYLLKNKLFSLINIIGLAFGLASFILIMRYVQYEKSYDQFKNSENVYRVFMDYKEGEVFAPGDAQTYNLSGPTIKDNFPEVKDYVRMYRLGLSAFLYNGSTIVDHDGAFSDANYFDVLQYDLLKGEKTKVLAEPSTIVLSETLAKKIFGEEDPIDKILPYFYEEKEFKLRVTGVMQDLPSSTHMKTSYLIPLITAKAMGENEYMTEPNWNANNFYTFLTITEGTDIDQFRSKLKVLDFDEGEEDERHNLEAIESIHLNSNKPYEPEVNGSATRVNFLSAIAIIILLLSWLNYVNLSTTKSLERAKEIGIRKVAGAQREQLIAQSILESLLLNALAIIISLLLVSFFSPIFDAFIGKKLPFNGAVFLQLLPYISIVVIGVLLSSLYPAFLLSSYQPAHVLKGKITHSRKGLRIRQALMVFQFIATIVLIIGTITVSKQISFIRNQPTGVELNRVLTIDGAIVSSDPDSVIALSYNSYLKELKQFPFVEKVALAQTFPGDLFDNLSSFVNMTFPNGTENKQDIFYNYRVSPNYFDLMGIKLLAGEEFKTTSTGYSYNIIINEFLTKKMGFAKPEDAINKTVMFWEKDWTIIGVMDDYHHFGLKNKMTSLVVMQGSNTKNLLVKLKEENSSPAAYKSALNQMENLWKEFFPQSIFGYKALDKNFELQYKEDEQFNVAFTVFTFLAILIAFLGLFGLTSYACLQRQKEIGIRKVNGATIMEILILLNKDFLKWVGIAFLIAAPVAWYIMKEWLSEFATQTELSWWIFALAGFLAFLIAVLTVSYQSLKSALQNPVESLRYE